MGYTQYLDLARENRSLVLIVLSSGVIYRPFIFSLSLDSSSLLSLSSLYIYGIAVYSIVWPFYDNNIIFNFYFN